MDKVRVFKKVERQPIVRRSRARIAYIKPDPKMPYVVQVFISPSPRHMYATVQFMGSKQVDNDFSGMVRSYTSTITGRPVTRPRFIVARMFLNAKSLRQDPGEIISHECAHAGMAWARLRKANLAEMQGEEVMCYATGRMFNQVNTFAHLLRVWG